MPKIYPRCQTCIHPERIRIEALRVAGTPIDQLAKDFGLSRDTVWRHCENHIDSATRVRYLAGPARVQELARAAAEEGRSVVDYLGIIRSTLVGQLDRAAGKNDTYGVALISSRLVEVLKELGKVSGELGHLASCITNINVTNNVAIMNTPQFAALQQGLIRVAQAHPEARKDIIALLRSLDGEVAAVAPPAALQIDGVAAHG